MSGCECENHNGAAYDTFATWDEDLTDILDDYKARLFPAKVREEKAESPSWDEG